ncbi:MAG: hypothetical protein K1X57_11095 [Gemmataceae bacterium]|nr:hypothetical protein [Gemmataceae bacterium]
MKTTLELPDQLVNQVNLFALRKGMDLSDTVALLLREGLAADRAEAAALPKPQVTIDPKTGFPVIPCSPVAHPEDELTPERVADILCALDSEVAIS